MNGDLLEEEATETSSRYNLVQHDEDNISVTEEFIFDDKIQKGIHSLKFNHNDQYVAAGINKKFILRLKKQIFNSKNKN